MKKQIDKKVWRLCFLCLYIFFNFLHSVFVGDISTVGHIILQIAFLSTVNELITKSNFKKHFCVYSALLIAAHISGMMLSTQIHSDSAIGTPVIVGIFFADILMAIIIYFSAWFFSIRFREEKDAQ